MSREKLSYIVLAIIIFLGVLVRLYQFSTPLADWHSFRQADTVSVAREYIKHGINPVIPKYHDLSNIQSGQDNLEGYRMVEFPFISTGIALTYPVIQSQFDLHQYYRLTTILFSALSIWLIFLIARMIDDSKIGLIAAAIFAFLPFSIFYSRTTLPEIPMVFFVLLSMYAFLKYTHTQKIWQIVIFSLSFCLALLIKPTAAFFIIPLVVYALIYTPLKFKTTIIWVLAIIFSFIPFGLWRNWIQQYPSGIPVNIWLLNGNGIRLRPAFFRWLFAERLGHLILGYWGLVLLAFGFLYSSTPKQTHTKLSHIKQKIIKFSQNITNRQTLNQAHLSTWFYNSWTIAMLLYLTIFATGNVQHDYYQVILLPLVSILVSRGISYLLKINTLTAYTMAFTCTIFMLGFSWFEIKGYYQINNWAIVAAGQAVDEKTPADALVIAPYMGDTAFLYQTNRRGWPLGHQIQDKIEMGAEYYVSTSYDDEARELESQYTLLEKTDDYILINLK